MLSRDKGGLALLCALAMVSGCADSTDPDLRAAAVGTGARIHYYYDALGRLIQAASTDGTGVQYSYDPVGNIMSSRRLAATTLNDEPGIQAVGHHVPRRRLCRRAQPVTGSTSTVRSRRKFSAVNRYPSARSARRR